MEQWLRDALAEEIGYTICPLTVETYTICDGICEECQINKDFIKSFDTDLEDDFWKEQERLRKEEEIMRRLED